MENQKRKYVKKEKAIELRTISKNQFDAMLKAGTTIKAPTKSNEHK